ncbi:YihY/virulence factor BrkB family protein [Kitasatospora sp. NPDC058201]|uniref:YihY/virulence factor BrkB family protein n=1 Tax=Streptomycetaceae TaxID=2062 RepID=UPI002E7660FC|nr:YihY/virulence factor BrkB family protein [Streptomyces sp. BE303]MED7951508.1 YihY/virulence factor BrkB family protein [Streptomyces sp. BE303]
MPALTHRHRGDRGPFGLRRRHPAPGARRAPRHGSDRHVPQPGHGVLRHAGRLLLGDELFDRAAALTYYGVLALFPGLLLLTGLLGLAGPSPGGQVMDGLRRLAPGPAGDVLRDGVGQVQQNSGAGGAFAVLGAVGALWSASGYVGAFIRSANAVHGVRERRPLWRLAPVRLALTAVLVVLLAAGVTIVVLTGPIAEQAGRALGVGDFGLTVWSFAKWPGLVLLVTLTVAVLYRAAPDLPSREPRLISPGSALAVALWLAASGGFALFAAYVDTFGRMYGALAGVMVFLVWLWLTNLAVLLGLELDAGLARRRTAAASGPAVSRAAVSKAAVAGPAAGRDAV